MATLAVDVKVDKNGVAQVNKLKSSLGQLDSTAKGSATSISGIATKIAGLVTALYGLKKAVDIGASFTRTAMEFERFQTILGTIEGSSTKAKKSMDWITDFTKKTPYELANVTDAFVKLRAYGIDPTDGTLKTLGDTASAMGKPLIQAVEAMADAVTGENERLKEFGIKASKNGDEIAYAWTSASGEAKSVIIENNSEIIKSTLTAIFNSKYQDAMIAQSTTLEGMLSNISDAYTIFQKDVMDGGLFNYIKALASVIGEDLNSAFGTVANNSSSFANSVIESINGIIKGVGTLANAFQGIGIFAETAWLTISAGFDALVVTIVGGVASLIDALNKIPGVALDNTWSKKISEDAALSFKNNIGQISGILDNVVDYEKKSADFVKRAQVEFDKFQSSVANAKPSNSSKVDPLLSVEAVKKESDLVKKLQDQYNTLYLTKQEQLKLWLEEQYIAIEQELISEEEKEQAKDTLFKIYSAKRLALMDKEVEKSKTAASVVEQAYKGSTAGMSRAFGNFFDKTSEGFMKLENLALGIAESIYTAMMQAAVIDPLVGGLMSGLTGSVTPQAHGGAWLNGVQKFATGGVVSSPTLFPMANGTGLMGEAGAEAIMPLTRIGGDLGVKATPSNVVVNIENNSGSDVSKDNVSTSFDGGTMIVNVVLDAINRNKGGMRDSIKGVR